MRTLPLLLLVACSGLPPVNLDGGKQPGSDAGLTDAGVTEQDAGLQPTEDAGMQPVVDAGMQPIVDAGYPPLTPAQQTVLHDRPYRTVVPTGYDPTGAPVPFVLLLHGYTDSGQGIDTYFKMSELAMSRNFILATPDGLRDSTFLRYWNATDYCCGSIGTQKTDDVAYLTAILDDARLKYRIDPKRVFVVGHSNGGFMAHRMACDRAGRIAAIASFAGAQWSDLTKCMPSEPVNVLEVHGDTDAVVLYAGGFGYPGAVTTTTGWATLDGCATTRSSAGTDLDLISTLPGADTDREQYACPANANAVQLWTIRGGSHIPAFTAAWAGALYDFLMAHPKP